MGGAALRAIVALFANTVRLSVGGGVGYTDAVRREIGVSEGYVLSPLLFSLAVSDLLEEIESLRLGLSLGGVWWCGAVALVDDVALLAASRDKAVAMLDAVVLWCWRRRYLLSLKKCAFLCAGPVCSAALGTRVAWRPTPAHFFTSRTIRALNKFQMCRLCHGGCVGCLLRMKRRDGPSDRAQTGGRDDPTFVKSAP